MGWTPSFYFTMGTLHITGIYFLNIFINYIIILANTFLFLFTLMFLNGEFFHFELPLELDQNETIGENLAAHLK